MTEESSRVYVPHSVDSLRHRQHKRKYEGTMKYQRRQLREEQQEEMFRERGFRLARLLRLVDNGGTLYVALGRFWRDALKGELVNCLHQNDDTLLLKRHPKTQTENVKRIVWIGGAKYLPVTQFWTDAVEGGYVEAKLLMDGSILLEKYQVVNLKKELGLV